MFVKEICREERRAVAVSISSVIDPFIPRQNFPDQKASARVLLLSRPLGKRGYLWSSVFVALRLQARVQRRGRPQR